MRYPHPGYLVLAANARYPAFRDPVLHSKEALKQFLIAKYGTVEALNRSWGSNYGTWDIAAPGSPKGFLDEDGTSRWVGGDAFQLRGASPAVKADLDAFLHEFAARYFKVVHDAIRAVDKNHLIFGPAALNNYGVMSRREILQAAAPYVDVFHFNYDVDPAVRNPMAGAVASYDLTGRPAIMWLGITANRDSDLSKFPQPYGMPAVATQAQRGAIYETALKNFATARGSNGDYFVVGFDFWSWGNHGGEQANWGLVSFHDNAFDGKEAVPARGKDPWGFATGGEQAAYGDFISSVKSANEQVPAELGLPTAESGNPPKRK